MKSTKRRSTVEEAKGKLLVEPAQVVALIMDAASISFLLFVIGIGIAGVM